MKKIAGASVIVFVELLVGTLFLLGLLYSRTESESFVVIENNNLSKMADVVSIMFNSDTSESAILDNDLDQEDENLQEEQDKKEDEKEVILENNKKETSSVENNTQDVKKEEVAASYVEEEKKDNIIKTYTGTLTGYGPDCSGCSGNTASGYYVGNTITYNDSTYGSVRIVAADKSIPFYSIVRISNVPGMDTITAIVLDTGGAVGFGKATLFDLLFASESSTMNTAYNVKFEILRWGGA